MVRIGKRPEGKGTRGGYANTERKCGAILDRLTEGQPLDQTLRGLGISKQSYLYYRKTRPDFARLVDQLHVAAMERRQDLDSMDVRDFAVFRKKYFGHDTYPHQAELVAALNNIQKREVGLVLMWAESGKTTTLEDWICKRLAEDPNLRIVHLSESNSLSEKVVGRIAERMTDEEIAGDFIYDFGPFYEDGQEREGKPWTRHYIKVAKATSGERDYSIESRAIKSRAQGSRIDILIIDDCQSRETLNQTEEILSRIQQTYLTRGRFMAIIFLGNRLGPGDVYDELEKRGIIDWKIEIPAVRGDNIPVAPEMWVEHPDEYPHTPDGRAAMIEDAQELIEKTQRQVGPVVWQASYQQNPQENNQATFPAEVYDSCLDEGRGIGRTSEVAYVEMAIDPALGGGNALVVGELTSTDLRLIDMNHQRGLARTEQILQIIRNAAIRYRPSALIVEENAFQKSLANDQRLRDMAHDLGFTIYPHQTGKEKNDMVLGVASMATSFYQHEISIPASTPDAVARFAALRTQLLAWRPHIPTRLLVQDCPMALWFLWKRWMEHHRARDRAGASWQTGRSSPLRAQDQAATIPTRVEAVVGRR